MFALLLNFPNGARAAQSSATNSAITLANPILFVTQIPLATYTNITFTFGNHEGTVEDAGRGGDLYIRYEDGTLKNLTAEAGYGLDVNHDGRLTGNEAIAVRDPAVHWNGTKAIFSMVMGAPTQQWQAHDYYWQLYEITGLGLTDTPVITKVANQPQNYNNVSPVYASDGRIIFTSDRPRNGNRLLYPQRDEYEQEATVTGLWSLNPSTAELNLLNHAPSGDFTPIVDSYGRVVFTQWDHLERDQLADVDFSNENPGVADDCGNGYDYGTFNYVSEDSLEMTNSRAEIYPEARTCRTDLLDPINLAGNHFNQFMPWTINQDGTAPEVLNHIGRHEFLMYINTTFTNDPNVEEYYGQYGSIANFNPMETGMFHIQEDPRNPGVYFGVDSPEFGYHTSGRLFRIYGPPGLDADQMEITYVTHPDTYEGTPTANHSGRYREPLPLNDGKLIAVHTTTIAQESGDGTNSDYAFRLRRLQLGANGYYTASQFLTDGITKTIRYWDPGTLINYNGPMWELNPVEVRARTAPATDPFALETPEQNMFDAAGVDATDFQNWMKQYNLALAVGHNLTRRDDMDKQQPFNLRVPGGAQTLGATGKIYDVTHLQFFQADQIRGLTWGNATPADGRRVIAQHLHDPYTLAANPQITGPVGSVAIATDGSFAAFVPANRALTWQMTDTSGTGVVRERYWLNFQPGEIRVCKSCHGLNQFDQAGNTTPENNPQALLQLLNRWKSGEITDAPAVQSVNRLDPNPTTAATVRFKVTFSKPVTGVDLSDFDLTTNNASGVTMTGLSGSDRFYTLTVSTGNTDNNTIRLDVQNNSSIEDAFGASLTASFTSGQVYTVRKPTTVVFRSNGDQDGWALESSESGNRGATLDSAATTFRVGDDAARKQYRGVLSFDTSSLPDDAVITKVTLKVKQQGIVGGGNPVTAFQGFVVDIKKGYFGSTSLQAGDFQAAAPKSVGPTKPAAVGGWYSLTITSAKAYVNALATNGGLTQIRLRFQLDDNNNAADNFLSLFSGNAATATRPQLIVEYYVP
jgi:hypothetical protein